jgi:hypothetical protein
MNRAAIADICSKFAITQTALVEETMKRIGEPGGMNFPYEFKWGGGEAIIYAANEQQAVWIFKTCDVDEQSGCAWPVSIRLMSDNE